MAPDDAMKSITSRIVLFIAVAGVAPLLIYGGVSVRTLRVATEQSIAAGHLAMAHQVAARFDEYFAHGQRVLVSIASELRGTQLARWQQQRILRNHVIDFPEFREIALFDANGNLELTSRATESVLEVPRVTRRQPGVLVAPPDLDQDLLPTTRIAVPIESRQGEPRGWIAADVSLEELWRALDEVRVGEHGYAMLIDQDGRFIAHGDPDRKSLIATRAVAPAELRDVASRTQVVGSGRLPRIETPEGTMVAVGERIGMPDWTLIIEQPEAEALAVARRLERQLYAAIGLALLATVLAGSWWGRAFIRRIFALTSVSRDLAAGQMHARVTVKGRDEIAQLGLQFNAMADRLVELQEEIRHQERQAMFGRIAAGLVHDLTAPVQVIQHQSRMIQRLYGDAAYRAEFSQTVDNQIATVKRVLEDLLSIARPKPLERFPVDLHAALGEAVRTMRPLAETAGIGLETALAREPLHIEADVFALGRVYRNLILNAIQATAPGGIVTVATEPRGDRVLIRIADTGCGIPPERLSTIFDDLVTTKKRGLGLGLAISKRIVEQLGGRISVSSQVGSGTEFVLDFARAAAAPVAQAAG